MVYRVVGSYVYVLYWLNGLFDYQVPLVVTIQLMSGSSSGVDGIKTDGCSLLFFIAYLPPPSPLNEFQGQRDKT